MKLFEPVLTITCCMPLLLITVVILLVIVLSTRNRTGLAGPVAPYPTIRASALVPAGWHPDPSGKHQLRYWDGMGWSAAVSDDGQVGSDPL